MSRKFNLADLSQKMEFMKQLYGASTFENSDYSAGKRRSVNPDPVGESKENNDSPHTE